MLVDSISEVNSQRLEQRLELDVLLNRLPHGRRYRLLESGNFALQLTKTTVFDILADSRGRHSSTAEATPRLRP